MYVVIRLVLVICGLVAQAFCCFRRDRLDKISIQRPVENNDSKLLVTCNESTELFSTTFLPGMLLLLLLLYTSWSRLCCKETDSKNLEELIKVIQSKKPNEYMEKIIFLIIFYVLFSQAVSYFNLWVFHLTGSNVTIYWPSLDWKVHNTWKKALIGISFGGFVAFDLLYAELIIRYVFWCQMNIYFQEIILDKVKGKEYYDQGEAILDVEQAKEFLHQLNNGSIFTGLAILLTAFLSTNCIIGLLSDNNDYYQTLALTCRLIIWLSLTLSPIFQAA